MDLIIDAIREGDYATTPSGRIVRVTKKLTDGKFLCSYTSFGGQVSLSPELLTPTAAPLAAV
jgi:hypothetical protein